MFYLQVTYTCNSGFEFAETAEDYTVSIPTTTTTTPLPMDWKPFKVRSNLKD